MDPGPYTAMGVFQGIRAAVRHVDGDADLQGVSVLVQGVGGVGGPLSRLLVESGARVSVSDPRTRPETISGNARRKTVLSPCILLPSESFSSEKANL